MSKKLVEKFFINQTTPEETERVLDWFETPKGKEYLKERLDIDYDLMDRKELRKMVPELKSNDLYQSIKNRIGGERKKIITHKRDWIAPAFKAAASILVILLTSVFYMMYLSEHQEKVIKTEPIHFETDSDHHREITLSDGSVVRLNSNSELLISENFMQDKREIHLNGEAYFDVAHNPDQPFIIHANQSTVQVLGTSFNVKSFQGQSNVQVAVVEGQVALKNLKSPSESETLSVTLSKGQYGYMDTQKRTILVDDLAVENYLAWKSGKFEFEDLSLHQVCTQLNRLYEIECNYSNEQIQNFLLTASFSNESLEKTLEVIALSLDIAYERNKDSVYWRMRQ